jgi:hypothetical protein
MSEDAIFFPSSSLEIFMRAKLVLVGGLALLLGSCAGARQAPPPLKKEPLLGKWKNSSSTQFVAGYKFSDDATARVTIKGMQQPILAHYTWSGDRSLDLEYQVPEEVQQAYQAAAMAPGR